MIYPRAHENRLHVGQRRSLPLHAAILCQDSPYLGDWDGQGLQIEANRLRGAVPYALPR
jgi:hypothetical protein